MSHSPTVPCPGIGPGAAARRRAWLVGVLLAALVLAQALGFVHRIVHGAGVATVQSAGSTDGHVGAGLWGDAFFAGHGGDNDCRLFDAVNVAGPASTQAQALPLVLASFFLASFQGDFVARWAALFDARGPPVFR